MKLAQLAFPLILVVVTFVPIVTLGQEVQAPPTPVREEAVKPEKRPPTQDMGQRLVEGLKSTEGCLGVDSARMNSGKNVIIAWFKDPESVRRWYRHPVHAAMLQMVGSDVSENSPLEHVKEDVPVMVVASITFTDKPEIEGIPMPISQIAIELFTPLPGGAYINSRLSPDKFEAPEMDAY